MTHPVGSLTEPRGGDTWETVVRKTDRMITAGRIARDDPCQSSHHDASALVRGLLGIDDVDLIAEGRDRTIDATQAEQLTRNANRRAEGEPLGHILGEVEFWSLPFFVNQNTLVPRSDSETLVSMANSMLQGKITTSKELKILDIGTGSGCLALSLLSEQARTVSAAIDISNEALDVARSNADRLNLQDRIYFLQSDLFDRLDILPERFQPPYDLIISNPPYIVSELIPKLSVEVRDFDPTIALDGGEDGLDFYRKIINQADEYIVSGGGLALEIGFDQSAEVIQMFVDWGYVEVGVTTDLAGRPRVVAGMTPLTR